MKDEIIDGKKYVYGFTYNLKHTPQCVEDGCGRRQRFLGQASMALVGWHYDFDRQGWLCPFHSGDEVGLKRLFGVFDRDD